MKIKNLNNEIPKIIDSLSKNKISRNILESKLKKYIKGKTIYDEYEMSKVVKQYEFYALWSMYKSFIRNVDKGNISSYIAKRIIDSFLNPVLLKNATSDETRRKFQEKYDMVPPSFITVSPTKKCNLKCTGCYAASSPTTDISLNWNLLNKVIEDAYTNIGMRFFVISGGEPLLYKSENKGILDLVEKWNDCYFLMYTNGTLINEDVASRMLSLGNITPAISVEGYEKQTDARRGKGIYQKILKARDNLVSKGIPFGISVTATSENIDVLLDESLYDYYFNEFGITYMWVFQYMPIGRDFSESLMITPEQRLKLHKMQDRLLIKKEYFIADFWNSAPMTNGCISCGGNGGYIYINWDGNIMPCVFIPYYHDNINTLYDSGKSLTDALFAPLFVKGREWQKKYIGDKLDPENLLAPCFYRDHYKNFYEIIANNQIKPENEDTQKAITSEDYYKMMIKFDEELETLTSPVWKELKEKYKNSKK